MHTPKIDPAPPPPNPAPQAMDEAVLAQRQNERRRQAAMYGRKSTILAGSGGSTSSFSTPTLMGAS